MNMVGIAANFYWMTLKDFTNAAQICVELLFDRFMYEGLTVLRAEHNVYVVFYE